MMHAYPLPKKDFLGFILALLIIFITPLAQAKTDILRVGIDLTYAPFAYLENNQPEGFDPDFMRLLASKGNKTAQFNDTRLAVYY